MSEKVAGQVIAAMAAVKHIPTDKITLEKSLEDLGVDSLDKVTLLFDLEKQFGISIPDGEIGSVRTVRDIVDGVSGLLEKTAASIASESNSPEHNLPENKFPENNA